MTNKKNWTVLVYDINAVPEESDLADIIQGFLEDGVVIYDSTRGKEPVTYLNIEKLDITDANQLTLFDENTDSTLNPEDN